MEFKFDPEADALRITLNDGKYEESDEVADGIIVDLTKGGEVMAVEILDVSEKISRKLLQDVRKAV